MHWIGREAMARDVEIGTDLMKEWLAELGLACWGIRAAGGGGRTAGRRPEFADTAGPGPSR